MTARSAPRELHTSEPVHRRWVGLALAAVILSTLNIVGGVVVTDRMLEMFKGRDRTPAKPPDAPAREQRDPDDKGASE